MAVSVQARCDCNTSSGSAGVDGGTNRHCRYRVIVADVIVRRQCLGSSLVTVASTVSISTGLTSRWLEARAGWPAIERRSLGEGTVRTQHSTAQAPCTA